MYLISFPFEVTHLHIHTHVLIHIMCFIMHTHAVSCHIVLVLGHSRTYHTIATYLPNAACITVSLSVVLLASSHINMADANELTEQMLISNDIALIISFGRIPNMPDALEVWRTNIIKIIKGHCGDKKHRLDIVNRLLDKHIKQMEDTEQKGHAAE